MFCVSVIMVDSKPEPMYQSCKVENGPLIVGDCYLSLEAKVGIRPRIFGLNS